MTLDNKIVQLSKLGDFLLNKGSEEELTQWAYAAKNENGWFTIDNVILSLKNIAKEFLNEAVLRGFANQYQSKGGKMVGIVAAGNIPLVGFHDLLCVILTDHVAYLKPSSSDKVLMMKLIHKLYSFDEDFRNVIILAERMNDIDAIIATGSDNSSRYFEHYFAKKPHVIRKNRSSVAVLTGKETGQELRDLGNDIFMYFGLGCRNVSKLLVPEKYNFDEFFQSIEYWNTILLHHKYQNNYDYNKSIYLINQVPHLDNGFLMLKEDSNLVSPLTVLFYETYSSESDLQEKLAEMNPKLQCIVGSAYIPFGQSQTPQIHDFADGFDTMQFLTDL